MNSLAAILLALFGANDTDTHWCKRWDDAAWRYAYGRCYDQEGGGDKNRPERSGKPDKPATE